jgi:AcrR family transcriptional regulator
MSVSTREVVFEAARRLFLRDGFAATTVRAIAAEAEVNPALVIRYHGSKEALFLASMAPTSGFPPVLEGSLDSLGEALVAFVIDNAGTPASDTYRALIMVADRPEVRERILGAVRDLVGGGLGDRLPGADRQLRARLLAAQVTGLMLSYWVLDDPILAATDRAAVIALSGRALQALITPA